MSPDIVKSDVSPIVHYLDVSNKCRSEVKNDVDEQQHIEGEFIPDRLAPSFLMRQSFFFFDWIIGKHFRVEANPIRNHYTEVKYQRVPQEVPELQKGLTGVQNQTLFNFSKFL